jgi:hypothetical protein
METFLCLIQHPVFLLWIIFIIFIIYYFVVCSFSFSCNSTSEDGPMNITCVLDKPLGTDGPDML